MRKIIFISVMLLIFTASLVYATMTNSLSDEPAMGYNKADAVKKLWKWAQEVETGIGSGDYLALNPTTEPAVPSEGMFYYDNAANTLKLYTGAAFVTLATASGNALDASYDAGSAITVDGDAVTLTVPDSGDNAALVIAQNDATLNTNGIEVVMASGNSGTGIYINGVSGSVDISGDNFSMPNTGILTCVGAVVGASSITMANADLIENSTDDMFIFNSNDKEDLTIDLAQTNIVALASTTGAVTFDFGPFDTVMGLTTLTGEAGAAFTISAANTGTYNLVLAQTGTGDNELRLTSAGTATNAIAITSSVAGITATALDDITIQVTSSTTGEDILITQVGANDSSITLTAAGTGEDAIGLQAGAGGVDIDAIGASAGVINVLAGNTLTMASTAGAASLTGGTSTTIGAITGTTSTSIVSGTGDITLDSHDAFTIICDGVMNIGADAIAQTITIGNETGASSLALKAGTGNINIQGVAASTITIGDAAQTAAITIGASTDTMTDLSLGTGAGAHTIHIGDGGTAAQVITVGSSSVASSVAVTAGTGKVTMASAGTGADAFNIDTSAGGIDIDIAGAAAGEDFDVTTNSSVLFTTTETAADQFKVATTGIVAGNAINLVTTDGGIAITAAGAANGDVTVTAADTLTLNSGASGILCSGDIITNYTRKVIADTDGETMSAALSGTVYTNAGAGGVQTFTLPEAAAGITYTFIVGAVQELRVDPMAGDTINIGGTAAAAAEYVTANAVGESITLVAVDTVQWIAVAYTGSWTEESPP